MVELVVTEQSARRHVLSALAADHGIAWDAHCRESFEERFDRHFPVLLRLFHDLYGARPDWLDQLTELVMQSARSWAERPADLKALDAEREHHSGWFQANTMLGGVCYVDRYAGDLAGVRARIPYFKELGLTYLHLISVPGPGAAFRRRLRRVQLPGRQPSAGHHAAAARPCRRAAGERHQPGGRFHLQPHLRRT